jgi:formate dehydrogenase subunit beta
MRRQDRLDDGGEKALREKAADLLSGDAAEIVIGYAAGPDGEPRPFLARTEEDAGKLIWTPRCVHNLAAYLTREPVAGILRRGGRVGIVLKGCDARSVVTLVQEKQVERSRIHMIGMVCRGVEAAAPGELALKCRGCTVTVPAVYDVLIGDPSEAEAPAGSALADVQEMLEKTPDERWIFWKKEMEKCIRCYACREVCPLCYCQECITEKSQPQWIDRAPLARGNLAYHLIRAAHLAGRCSSCGECGRVCPVGIPVDMLNRFLTERIKEAFGYECGTDCGAEVFQAAFRKDADPEDFIR